VFSGLSLEVPRGQLVAVIGTSGCGKTTLLNMVSGLVTPTSGELLVFGKRPGVGRTDVGYMLARDALLPWRTAVQNVELGLELRGIRRTARRERAVELLGRVDLSSAGDKYPAQLSQGMRQRVALARTWATDPELMLMDEPFAALDALTRATVRDVFLRIWDDPVHRKTVLFVTHDLTEALILADRVVTVTPTGIGVDVCVPYDRPRDLRELMANANYREVYDSLEQALTPGQ
jgi:NitT/TauT family transport system ATP-binding protein